jgi:spermidine synthase
MNLLLGLFVASMATLATELTLIRVFDVVLTFSTAYIVVTCALFGFGVAGVWRILVPLRRETDIGAYGVRISLLLALSLCMILPITNALPINFRAILEQPAVQGFAFGTLMVILGLPFFYMGLLLAALFERYADQVSRLYFWDLAGAAVGCVIVAPLFPLIGPGGVLIAMSGLACVAAALFSSSRIMKWTFGGAGVSLILLVAVLPASMLDFVQHMDKRGVKRAHEAGLIEFSRWDPISKIEVYDSLALESDVAHFKHIGYDGGHQSSYIYPFDGNFARLRDGLEQGREKITDHFWQSSVAASHYLRADQEQKVLVLGSAGGQETKAALMFGAGHVDAVEMVGTVVDLGLNRYSDFNGGVFRDPRVKAVQGEGRAFLRASNERYDIIQIFSNHTSSSIASGVGAMQTSYTQTAEAYREYFDHLDADGVLQINHHVFPKMITTAALGWKMAGRGNFQRHVAVWQRPGEDYLPTMIIKMKPWTAAELDRVQEWFDRFDAEQNTLMVDPLDPQESFLHPAFFDGALPDHIAARVPFRVHAATDDRPYFNFYRKHIAVLQADPAVYLDEGTASLLNAQLKGKIPYDQAHLYVTAVIGLLFALFIVIVPLRFSKIGRTAWTGRTATLLYFACLGCGFIMIELVFIQIFMRLIGSPLHTSATVVATMLLSAAWGSLQSRRLGVSPDGRWMLPFAGVAGCLGLFLFAHEPAASLFLTQPLWLRMAAAAAMIFPIGFFLGMPFPLGIAALEGRPDGSIAWGWSMNALFTVLGGILSVILSIFIGFQLVLALALVVYVAGGIAFAMMRRPTGSAVGAFATTATR